jgi:asparagine synthase (glutamine-hydrolysing)
MCGIAGLLHRGQIGDASERVQRMTDAIRHRGPDGEGYWANGEIALGFRRLAIVDLESGDQPMPNEDGTVQVVFNGEIYNHADLRRELVSLGHIFRSHHCDTEVLVHGWEQWGEALLPRLNGMFAFAIWDEKNRELTLARDRLGIKPLYVHETVAGHVLFGSEVRALTASGLTPRTFEAAAVIETFSFMNIWGGRTPYTGIRLLKPGTLLRFRPGRRLESTYWQMQFDRRPSRSPAKEDGVFRQILREAIGRQMAADVPIATYLSGGIDSTAITAIAHTIDPATRAYSCIFELESVGADAHVDERDFSRQAAIHIGVDRIEHLIPNHALIESLPHTVASLEYGRMGMAYVNDLLARRVAADVKVVLSGLGGDETTGGYVGRYAIVPHPHRSTPSLGLRGRLRQLLYDTEKADPLALYRQALNVPIGHAQISDAFTPEFVRAGQGFNPAAVIDDTIAAAPSRDPWDIVMYVDATTYLQGLLVLEDKLSMAYGLETRVPLLDNAVLDYLLSIEWSLLSDGIEGKQLFRRAVAPWVPKIIAQKPKMGFAPPDASWYRTSLKSFIEHQLAPGHIVRRGVFQPKFVERVLAEHATGAANHVALIWSLLSFEVWCGQTGAFGGALP